MKMVEMMNLLKKTREHIKDEKLAAQIDDALKKKVKVSSVLFHQKGDNFDRWGYLISDSPITFGMSETEEKAYEQVKRTKDFLKDFYDIE